MKTILALRGTEQPALPNRTNTVIRTEVRFGTVSSDCRGTGICRMDFYRSPLQWRTVQRGCDKCKGAIALLTSTRDRRLKCGFLKDSMCKNALRRFFSNDQFIVEEDFELPRSICRALRLNHYTIGKGVYSVAESDGLITVIF